MPRRHDVLYSLLPAAVLLLYAISLRLLLAPVQAIGYRAALILAAAALLLAVLCHCRGAGPRGEHRPRPAGYLLSLLFTTLAAALAMGAYYAYVGTEVTLPALLYALLPSAAVLLLYLVLTRLFPDWLGRLTALLLLSGLLMTALFIVGWVRTRGAAFPSFAAVTSLTLTVFLLALYYLRTDPATLPLRYLSFAGFGYAVVVVAAMAVLIAALGGDCDCGDCDCGNCSSDDSDRKTKKRR